MRDMGGYLHVPVSKLVCDDVRMSSLLTEERPIHRKEMPLFLSILDEVIDRWYEAVGSMNPDIYATYKFHTELLDSLKRAYDSISNDDSGDVFIEREKLSDLMDAFSDMLTSFSEAFTGPPELKSFYRKILTRVDDTNNIIMEGKHGW